MRLDKSSCEELAREKESFTLPTPFLMVSLELNPGHLRFEPFELSIRKRESQHQTSSNARNTFPTCAPFFFATVRLASRVCIRSTAIPIILHSAILRAATRMFASPRHFSNMSLSLSLEISSKQQPVHTSVWCYARDIGISLHRISNAMYIPPEVCVSSSCFRIRSRVEPLHLKNDYEFSRWLHRDIVSD